MGTRIGRAIGIVSLSLALGGSMFVMSPQGGAQADPDAVTRAQQKLEQIEQQASEADAKYSELQDALDQATQKLGAATKDLGAQEKKVQGLSKSLGRVALDQYQTQGVNLTTKLLTSGSDDDFLGSLATINAVQTRTNERIQDLQLAQADLAAARRQADQSRARIAASKADQAKVAAEYQKLEADAKAVVEKLTAEEKKRLEELKKKQEAERLAQAAAATASSSQAPSPSATAAADSSQATTTSASSVPASGRAAQAMQYAMAQVGKSYVMGATGPSAYDCSGLMLAAYGSAGVGLPRTSQDQFGAGTAVSISDLQPGDLVFYYSGISHVAMYIGNGKIVHASNPRTGVKISPVGQMPIAGARRVA